MRARKTRQLRIPAQSRTHTLMLVQSHTNPVASPTNTYRRINITTLNSLSTRMSEIRIIT